MPGDSKAELRRRALAARDALTEQARRDAAQAIARRAFPVAVRPGMIVSGFMPIGSEIDPLPLMRNLTHAGAKLALPVVAGRGKPLIMRAWAFGEPLIEAIWNIKVPGPSAAIVEPDILIVPFAAFDRAGHRIGYGAGYYDRTIAGLRAKKAIVAIGFGLAVQEIPQVPATEFDQRLDYILTERETIKVDLATSPGAA